MRTETALQPIFLKDYAPYPFELVSVYLDFDLEPELTTVRNRMALRRHHPGPLVLDGEDIRLVSVSVDGKALKRSEYKLDQKHLTLDVPDLCEVEIVTTCKPADNTTLMGLYTSGGRFCTQCEAEGFRRITFYPDRPDVMSVFTTRMVADKEGYPHLLSNGNRIAGGDLDGGKHFAVWNDPFPKPAYLFALVAGEFDVLRDSFTTMSGREVSLEIYIDPGQLDKAEYAMDALKRSMRWDEEAYGREYDLDRFMVVAVRDFNFGAMENKGLNIFNSSLLAANPQTATDLAYERIESVVAHEYFHNWTGNRITCRDWFQLCLKEGFTVFRDQQFSADQRDPTVQRIKDVKVLRARQFAEDAGPLAHPVRPESFVKIDNFYTATVYEKGAEIIRMIHTLLGPDRFRKGADRYFELHDGRAATVEDFLSAFGEGADYDLTPFGHWYSQAGTPQVDVRTERDGNKLHVHLEQRTSPTPGQSRKSALPIPFRFNVVGDDGAVTEPEVILFDTPEMSTAIDLPAGTGDVTVSAFTGFSAPVVVTTDHTAADRLRLMGGDPDGFNRWEAGQAIAKSLVVAIARALQAGDMPEPDPTLHRYTSALAVTLADPHFGHAFKALALTPPADLAEYLSRPDLVDPLAVTEAVRWLERAIGDELSEPLLRAYDELEGGGEFDPGAEAAGRRALRNRALALLSAAQHPQAPAIAIRQLAEATNMTDEIAALSALSRMGGKRVDDNFAAFRKKHDAEPLVIDQWFALQGRREHANGLSAIRSLTQRDDYTRTNPNRVRSLLGAFAMGNPYLFHAPDGSGYRFLADEVLDLETRNPQVAARMLGLFEFWPKVDDARKAILRDILSDVRDRAGSDQMREIATKLLAA